MEKVLKASLPVVIGAIVGSLVTCAWLSKKAKRKVQLISLTMCRVRVETKHENNEGIDLNQLFFLR